MVEVLFRYLVQDIFEYYSSREEWPNTAPFFAEVGLRKFILASELFVLRSYFIQHLTAKQDAKISLLPLQFILQRG